MGREQLNRHFYSVLKQRKAFPKQNQKLGIILQRKKKPNKQQNPQIVGNAM